VYGSSQASNYPNAFAPPPVNVPPAGYPAAVPPVYPDTYHTKLEDVARHSREIWQTLGAIKDIPGSVKVYVTVHHLAKRFRSRFYEAPPLTMFIDGLSNNKEMRPVRNINGLICKACHLGLGNAASVEQDRKSFSLPQLTNHFQFKHIEPMRAHNVPPLDWVEDMVLLPDQASLSNLRPSTDYQKSLLNDALAGISRLPQPAASGSRRPQQLAGYARQDGTELQAASHPAGYEQPSAQVPAVEVTGVGTDSSRPANDYVRDGSAHQSADNHTNSRPFQDLPPSYGGGQSSDPYTRTGYADNRVVSGPPPENPDHRHRPYSNDGRHSPPQGRRREKGAHQLRKKGGGKYKQGRSSGVVDSPNHIHGEELRNIDDTRSRDTSNPKTGRSIDRGETTHAFSPLGKRGWGQCDSTAPREVSNGFRGSFSRNAPGPPRTENEESGLLSALEMHLDHERSRVMEAGQRMSSTAHHLDSRGTTVGAESHGVARSHTQYESHDERARSPRDETHYRPTARYSPSGQPTVPATYPAPGEPNRREAGYGDYGLPRETQPYQRFRETRYDDRPPLSEDRGHIAEPRPEHYHHADDAQPRPRHTVETYEIVQVIDERGEYYIRRPVRHIPEHRHTSGEPWKARRGEDVYPPQESSPYVTASTGGRPRDASGFDAPHDVRAADSRASRRADPVYYEEYDPRFPGA